MKQNICEKFTSISNKVGDYSNKCIDLIKEKATGQNVEWISSNYEKIKDLSERNPGTTLILSFTLMGLAAWKFRGGDDEQQRKQDEFQALEESFKWQQSTAMKSDESLLIVKGQMESITELQDEQDMEDRLFFEVYKKYQQS